MVKSVKELPKEWCSSKISCIGIEGRVSLRPFFCKKVNDQSIQNCLSLNLYKMTKEFTI